MSPIVGKADQRKEVTNGAQNEASGISSKRHSLSGGSASSSEMFRDTSKGQLIPRNFFFLGRGGGGAV